MDAAVLRDVAINIAGYFRDFIESDFKKIQTPSRRIVLQSDSGFRAGMRLKPYEGFERDVWKLLQQPSGEPMQLRVTPRKYTRALSPVLRKVIEEQIAAIAPDPLISTRAAVRAAIDKTYAQAISDPEQWVEQTLTTLSEEVSAHIVRPLIGRLDGPLQRQAYSVIDSLYAAETDMVAAVAAELAGKLPEVLARHLARRDDEAVQGALDTFLTLEHTQEALGRFFEGFITADAVLEVRDLETYAGITDGVTLCLYIGALRFRNAHYPLLFLPVSTEKLPEGAGYELTFVNQLFANRAAIDFVLQELAAAKTREWASPITDRINYLQPAQSVYEVARGLFGMVASSMDLAGQITLGSTQPDASTADVTLSCALHLCAFEQGAESLVNDYEALIDMARRGGSAVVDLFEDLVRGVLVDNPKSIRAAVEADWDALPLVERLVFDSPIPLNEEQRKILLAVRHPEGRIVVVEGPPGTGKSHTITAIAADCAFNQRSCLVLSDKTEALQVVQDKLSEAMNRVRHDPDFPNPLLRLGRQDANFKKLVGNQTVNQIAAYAKAMKANEADIEAERADTAQSMKRAIEQTVATLGSIELRQVQALHESERRMAQTAPDALQAIQGIEEGAALQTRMAPVMPALPAVVAYLGRVPPAIRSDQSLLRARATRDHAVAEFCRAHPDAPAAMQAFERLDATQVRDVATAVLQYRQLRMPVFGYLFRGGAVRAIEARLNALPTRRPLLLKSEADTLEAAVRSAGDLKQALERAGVAESLPDAYAQATAGAPDGTAASHLLTALEAMAVDPAIVQAALGGDADRLGAVAQVLHDWLTVREAFRRTPQFDYVGTKTRLERLNTSRMNAHVDSRLVGFMEEHRADAKTLAQLIAQRQKFPAEKFEAVRSSFPVIIAGIREFGEYMPLVPSIFDVVVIDEASQVSVAQALPAILRARKVVVLGDSKQFANVKSSNASIAVNDKYRANLVRFFERTVQRDAAALQRLAMFDVKKSILEFCGLAASYTIMLRKHFRSFPELIGYSSRSFYDGQLQAIRIRGVPIEQVIRFDAVEPRDRHVSRTTNAAEADYIAEQLVALLDQERPPSVGVITPFREQHTLLTKTLFSHPRSQDFEDKLRLRVFTFDSCQGEERRVIFYSMVATPGQDALAYIFPANVEGAKDLVEEKLKVQRLNVGFSRAQDTIRIVHSMPIGLFRGAIGQALNHYAQALTLRRGSIEQTDASSPMEAKVLHWLQSTQFVQAQGDAVEILPQFPLGEYLKQLDPTYEHPAYRVDFLVTCQTPKGPVQIVIEYDGWEHHFQKGREVHVGNHHRYMKESDVERQLTLESYGYRFIRLNRFNAGKDPVAMLDERLMRIVEMATGESHAKFVERLREQAKGMMNKEMRQCSRCGDIKPLNKFWDRALRAGAGAHGRICVTCKFGN